jgi:predicted XRE-type DNA-binding protein
MRERQLFTSVWDAIEEQPDDVQMMKLRSTLMMALQEHITGNGMTQIQAAELLHVTQPQMSDLTRGRAALFGLETLVNIAASAGLHVELKVTGAG